MMRRIEKLRKGIRFWYSFVDDIKPIKEKSTTIINQKTGKIKQEKVGGKRISRSNESAVDFGAAEAGKHQESKLRC